MAANTPPESTGWTASTSNPDPRPPRTPGTISYPNFNFEVQGIDRAPNAHNWQADTPVPSAFLGSSFVNVLANTVMNDASCQRKLMVGVHFLLTNSIVSPQAPELQAIVQRDRRAVNRIVRNIRRIPEYTLMLEATLRWCEARGSDDHSVLVASEKFANIGKIDWLAIPEMYPKEYADMQRQFHRESELLQTRSVIRASNSAEMMKIAPGAYGLQFFSTSLAIEFEARGGWKTFAIHEKHGLKMPEKHILKVMLGSCWNCITANMADDCNRESLGCSRCKHDDGLCNYDYLEYVDTFQNDETLKLADVLKPVGHGVSTAKAVFPNHFSGGYKHNRSDEEVSDDQYRHKKSKSLANLRFNSKINESLQKQKSRQARDDTEMPDFPNLMKDISSRNSTTKYSNLVQPNNSKKVAPRVAVKNENEIATKSPTTPPRAKTGSALAKKTPSPIRKRDPSNPHSPFTVPIYKKDGKYSFTPPGASSLSDSSSDFALNEPNPILRRSPRGKKTNRKAEKISADIGGISNKKPLATLKRS